VIGHKRQCSLHLPAPWTTDAAPPDDCAPIEELDDGDVDEHQERPKKPGTTYLTYGPRCLESDTFKCLSFSDKK